MSLTGVPGVAGILGTRVVTTLVFVLFARLASERGGRKEVIRLIGITDTMAARGAGVGVVHVYRLISDHGGPGHLDQVLVIIVLETAPEVMEGQVTWTGLVSLVISCPGHVS